MKSRVKGTEWQRKPLRREAREQVEEELNQHHADAQLDLEEFCLMEEHFFADEVYGYF